MSEPQGEYRIQPLKRIAKVYRFPEPSKEEREKLEQERQEIADQKAMDVLRRQAGLPEKYPPPWYRRVKFGSLKATTQDPWCTVWKVVKYEEEKPKSWCWKQKKEGEDNG